MGDHPGIGAHGIVGDLRSAALITTGGRVSWFCAGRFDSPSVFNALLDEESGGRWDLHPVGAVARPDRGAGGLPVADLRGRPARHRAHLGRPGRRALRPARRPGRLTYVSVPHIVKDTHMWEAPVHTATRRLGRSDIEITAIGLGCMQFSGRGGIASGAFTPLAQDAVTEIVRTARAGGIGWFDTAEMYGFGQSERALGSALHADGVEPGEVVVATKWLPLARTAGNLVRTVDTRLAALQGYPIDLHQIHMPYISLSGVPAQMRAMARLVRAGKVRAVGVSNFGARQLRLAHDALAAEGIPLASNQVRISLLDRRVERSGVLRTAQELGITLIAYSPLANGVLTGRFHDDPGQVAQLRPLRRLAGSFRATDLARTAPLVRELTAIGAAHGASASQVALSWLVHAHGDTVVAIPGASKPRHAAEAAAVLDLRLTDAEMARLEELSRPLS